MTWLLKPGTVKGSNRHAYPMLVPRDSKGIEGKQPQFYRAAGESMSSVEINIFPRKWRIWDSLEKHFSLEEIFLKFDLEFQKRILVTGEEGERESKREMNRIIHGLESSGLRSAWESRSMCGDCQRHRWGLSEMSDDGLWQMSYDEEAVRQGRIGCTRISSGVQGTQGSCSPPTDGSTEFCQGVGLVRILKKSGLVRYNSLPLLVAE